MGLRRRSVLTAASGIVAVSASGCTSSSDDSDTSPEQRDGGPEREERSVSYAASVVDQFDGDRPPRIEGRLTNDGDVPVEVLAGVSLLVAGVHDEDHSWPEAIVLDPGLSGVEMDQPIRTEDGCWRFPDDGMIELQSILKSHDVRPGDSITETYDVYTRGRSGECLPEGEYVFQNECFVDETSNSVVLSLELRIDSDQSIATEGYVD